MGIHFANAALIDNAALDPQAPELLIYEQRGGRLRLVGVEFLVIAEAWHAANPGPPVLLGQHFQLVGAPNRYGLPPFYELHVWASSYLSDCNSTEVLQSCTRRGAGNTVHAGSAERARSQRLNLHNLSPAEINRIVRGFQIAPVRLNLRGKDLALVGLGSYT